MAIELFSIGTELVLGRIQDTNAHWIAQQILESGGELRRVTMLRDDREEMTEALNSAIERATSLILTTGGLGPTPDDMTTEIVASLTRASLAVHAETVAEFRKRREMSENEPLNEALMKMATVPEAAVVLQNPAGWAPCMCVDYKASTIVMMPGPPREMKAVFETHIQPLIEARYRAGITMTRGYVNMFEAAVSPLMEKVTERYPEVYLKAYVGLRAGDSMPVDIIVTSTDKAKAETQLELATNYFRALVAEAGNRFSLDDE